jgi:hypothetical protein
MVERRGSFDYFGSTSGTRPVVSVTINAKQSDDA